MIAPLLFIACGLLGLAVSMLANRLVRSVWVRNLLDALVMSGGAVYFAWHGLWFPAAFFAAAACLFLWMVSRS